MSEGEVSTWIPPEEFTTPSGAHKWPVNKGILIKTTGKRLRNLGQAYISRNTNKLVPARKASPPFSCTSRCYEILVANIHGVTCSHLNHSLLKRSALGVPMKDQQERVGDHGQVAEDRASMVQEHMSL